jgi:nucleotide exchange factor SIL1
MFLAILVLLQSTTFFFETSPFPIFACAKEIVATPEWQQVKEGDTIPKGLHIRMDFETGTKWVKLLDEEESKQAAATSATAVTTTATMYTVESNSEETKAESSSKGPKITQLTNPELTPEASAKITNSILEQERQRTANYMQSVASLNDFENGDHDSELDYEMMYRALKSLPQEEQDRMGVTLPSSLPEEDGEGNESASSRQEFEATIRKIWMSRQELLKRMEEEHLANIPDLIQERVKFLEGYIVLPVQHLRHAILSSGKEQSEVPDNIISVLEDLEYHVADIDMARDFHSMGGLPLLVSLLTDSIHGLDRATDEAIQFAMEQELNSTSTSSLSQGFELNQETLDYLEQMQETIWKVQSLACWTIGTAVKNAEEFWGWALEDFSDLTADDANMGTNQTVQEVNLISILSSKIKDITPVGSSYSLMKLKQKEIYALGSLLRGNRNALQYFVSIGGPRILGQLVDLILSQVDSKERVDSITSSLLSKAVTLADDLIMDVVVHPMSSGDSQERSINEQMDRDVIDSFTTDEWCSLPLQIIQLPSVAIKRKMLQTIVNMAPHCSYETIESNKVEESISERMEDDDFVQLIQKFHTVLESQ